MKEMMKNSMTSFNREVTIFILDTIFDDINETTEIYLPYPNKYYNLYAVNFQLLRIWHIRKKGIINACINYLLTMYKRHLAMIAECADNNCHQLNANPSIQHACFRMKSNKWKICIINNKRNSSVCQ